MKPIRVDVEPLGGERWARIEESLDAKLDEARAEERAEETGTRRSPARSPLRWAAGLAVAASVAALFASRSFYSTPALNHPTRIVTTTSASHLAVGDSALDVAPSSALTVDPGANGIVVVLERGRVECEVAPQDHAHPFVVRAGDYSVRVVGTHFTVTRDSDDARGKTHASVDVARGTVEVTGAGSSATLHAGDHWSSPVAEAAIEPVPTIATTAATPAPTMTDAPLPASTSAIDRPKTTASSAQQDFESAASFEKSDPARAIAIYDRLARGTGAWAENALFAEARLESDRGNTAVSRALLERYLERYPSGANVTDARELLQRP